MPVGRARIPTNHGYACLVRQIPWTAGLLAPFPGQKSDKVASSRYNLIGV